MAILHDLDAKQIHESLSEACQRGMPLNITLHDEHGWSNYHSRLVHVDDQFLFIEPPIKDHCQTHGELAPAARIGASFKLKHYKHIFIAAVAGMRTINLHSGDTAALLAICVPAQMQRLQRRAFIRAEVPANRVVRAAFWIGGQQAEPKKSCEQTPVWFGRVQNISAGGFQISCGGAAAAALDEGDIVGVRLSFGTAAGETVFADAQFRHIETTDQGPVMGFQFIGLAQSPKGRLALEVISSKVGEFQHHANLLAGKQDDNSELKAG